MDLRLNSLRMSPAMQPVPGNERSEVGSLPTSNGHPKASLLGYNCGSVINRHGKRHRYTRSYLCHKGFHLREVCNRSVYAENGC